jgi:guanine nucleotide-binding protein G(I)/G(S)/G(T) subunit beta-1
MDGNVFSSGSSDLTFRVWDIRQKKSCFRIFEKNKCGVSSIKFMPENINTLAVGHEDGSVKIWDLRAIGKIGKFKEENFFETVQSMCFSKSGRLLFAAYNTNKIKIWDMLTEQKVGEMGEPHKDVIRSISLSEDGQTLISAGKDGVVNKWQYESK